MATGLGSMLLGSSVRHPPCRRPTQRMNAARNSSPQQRSCAPHPPRPACATLTLHALPVPPSPSTPCLCHPHPPRPACATPGSTPGSTPPHPLPRRRAHGRGGMNGSIRFQVEMACRCLGQLPGGRRQFETWRPRAAVHRLVMQRPCPPTGTPGACRARERPKLAVAPRFSSGGQLEAT